MTRKWLFVFVFLLMVATTFTINGKEDETFTEEELNYIKTHPVIQTAVDPEFTPYEFIDIDGEYKGIAADYLNLIAKRTGLRFEIRADLDWEEAYDKAIDGEIQLLPCIGKTIQREKLFLFTDSYLTYQRVLLSNVQTRSYSFSDLSKCRVGVQKNSSHYSFIIGETDIEPVLFKTSEELLLALSYNEIDVAITNYGSSRYLIKQSGIGNITIDDLYEEGFIELGMAISNNDEVLRSILDKGLKMITEQEKTQIQNDW